MRRTKAQAEETHKRLLQAGVEVFLEKGFDKASLEEIAQRVKMTRGAVYWHFKDKQAIFDTLVEQTVLPVQARLEAILKDTELTPLQRITTFVKTYLHLLAEDEEYRRAHKLIKKYGATVPGNESRLLALQAEQQQTLETLYWQAQTDRSVLSHVYPRYMATYSLAVINGMSQHLLDSEASVAERHRLADRMVFLLMRSLQ